MRPGLTQAGVGCKARRTADGPAAAEAAHEAQGVRAFACAVGLGVELLACGREDGFGGGEARAAHLRARGAFGFGLLNRFGDAGVMGRVFFKVGVAGAGGARKCGVLRASIWRCRDIKSYI